MDVTRKERPTRSNTPPVRIQHGWLHWRSREVGGLYHIEQQPSADNDWTLVIRVDDEWTPYGNSAEVIV